MLKLTPLILIIAIECMPLCNADCIFPWVAPATGSPCYQVGPSTQDYHAADLFCKRAGGFLAEPKSATETGYLQSFLSSSLQYWIGLTDLAIEGAFLWGSDLTAPTYTNWDTNQPDNFDNDEDCVVVTGKHTMKWNDIPCWYTDGTYAVCQKAST